MIQFIVAFLGKRGAIVAAVAFALAVALGVQTVRLVVAEAAVTTAEADVKVLRAEKAALEADLADAVKSSQDWERIAGERATLLKQAQDEAERLRTANADAIAKARADAADAERTLGEFIDRYADSLRITDCNAALNRLEAACPALLKY